MNEQYSKVGRRNFLGTCVLAGAGLASGFHRNLANGVLSCPEGGNAPIGGIRVGLDIGTSKVCAAVGELLPDGTIKLLGIGQASSHGVTAHGIIDAEATGACVRAALVDAEIQSDVVIRSVVLAVPGTKVGPFDSGPIWEQIFEWEETCYAAGSDGSLYPVSLADCKRARDMSVVYGAHERIQHSIHCLQKIGVEVERLVFAPVASAAAVLSAIDKERGVLVIDMGEGTTDYAVYAGGTLVQSDCLPAGGGHIANDLSLGLRIPLARATRLLIQKGSVWLGSSLLDDQRIVLAPEPGFADGEIEREVLNTIIHERVRAIFERVKCRLVNSGVRLNSLRGVRLSGGCYRLPGIEHLALEIFDLFPDCRFRMRGCIEADMSILNDPRLACAVGLVKLAAPIGA